MSLLYQSAAQAIKNKISGTPTVGLILGSGLGNLADEIENPVYIDYSSLPGFPEATVEGHLGRFVYGIYEGQRVLAMQGRFHYYEGKSIEEVVLPVRVMKDVGIQALIVTNAAGGIDSSFQPGDLMIISDHINFSGVSPLRGQNVAEFGPRFPDMSYAYAPALQKLALKAASELNIPIKSGVYGMMPGPNYETPAEIRMLRLLGAHAVGMSTVPEVVAAVHAGIRVLGISCITNMAAGILNQSLSHAEVIETAEKARNSMVSLLRKILVSLTF